MRRKKRALPSQADRAFTSLCWLSRRRGGRAFQARDPFQELVSKSCSRLSYPSRRIFLINTLFLGGFVGISNTEARYFVDCELIASFSCEMLRIISYN